MKLKPFELERYFAKYEFSVKYLLSSSDCDGLAAKDLLELADSETRKMWENLKLGYTESLGLPQLRQEIAKFLGCEVTKWQPSEEDNWRLDPAFLESNIKSNTRLIIMNFPHNPTGSLASKEDYLRIVDIAKQNNIYLFSDEMYKFLELNPKDRLPSAVELYDKAITLFGMSKTFGMAGTRIGWVITKDKKLYSEMAAFKDYTTICSSAPSEILSLIALRAKDTTIQKHLKRINRNLGLLDDFFKKYSNLFSWVRPKAGTICFPKLLFDKSSFDFCEDVVKEAGIMVLPSTVYDYDDKHFRIGFGRENMPEALQEFESYVYKKLT